MNFSCAFGLNSVILIFLIVNVFKPFIGSYAARRVRTSHQGRHRTANKDAEGIKAKIF